MFLPRNKRMITTKENLIPFESRHHDRCPWLPTELFLSDGHFAAAVYVSKNAAVSAERRRFSLRFDFLSTRHRRLLTGVPAASLGADLTAASLVERDFCARIHIHPGYIHILFYLA